MSGRKSLWKACLEGDLEGARAALGRGEGVDTTGEGSSTPLMVAVSYHHNSIVELLLTHNPPPDINRQDSQDATVLHAACMRGNQWAVARLVALPNISLNTQNNQGGTPIMAAACSNHIDCVRQLARLAVVDLGLRDMRGRTAEDIAR